MAPSIPGRSVHLCEEKGTSTRGAVVCRIELAEGKAPDWVMLFPAPDAAGEIKCRDGRVYRMTNQADIVSAFNSEAHPIAFDRDHGVEKVMWGGGDGAAVGWIEELKLGDGGSIMCRVEWTDEGAELVESKKYRYVSPAFNISTEVVNSIEKLRITMPTSAGLTNRPAMVMPALTNASGEPSMKKLLELLGLQEGATQEQIDEATKAFQAKELADKQALEAANATLKAELAAAKLAQQGIDKVVPRADFDAMKSQVAALQGQIDAGKQAAHQAAVNVAITEAMKAGKIAPASEAYHRANCASETGLAGFVAYCASAPVIAPDSITPASAPAAGYVPPTALEFEVAEKCGTSREALIARAKAAAGIAA